MINELLEKREILGDIAVELYGDLWITNDEFWDSPTERDLREVNEQLLNLGWEEEVDEDQIMIADMIADMIMEMLKKGGKFEDPRK